MNTISHHTKKISLTSRYPKAWIGIIKMHKDWSGPHRLDQ